jgi:hypothetical protein
MAKITVTQILDTRKCIEELSKARDGERDRRDQEIHHLHWDIYQKKIRDIEEERDNAIRAVEATRDKAIAEKNKEIEAHNSVIEQAKRILAILSANIEPLAIGDDEVKTREYGTETLGESLGYLLDDDYLKIKLFIILNSKPKNKYSLIAVGRSIFDEPLIKYHYGYGMEIQDSYLRFKLKVVLKDAPTPDELRDWLKKHKVLADTLEEYQRVKQEYIATKQEYKTDDFKELITWACPQCNNFRTIFDSSYARGETPQCYRHEPHVDMKPQIKDFD